MRRGGAHRGDGTGACLCIAAATRARSLLRSAIPPSFSPSRARAVSSTVVSESLGAGNRLNYHNVRLGAAGPGGHPKCGLDMIGPAIVRIDDETGGFRHEVPPKEARMAPVSFHPLHREPGNSAVPKVLLERAECFGGNERRNASNGHRRRKLPVVAAPRRARCGRGSSLTVPLARLKSIASRALPGCTRPSCIYLRDCSYPPLSASWPCGCSPAPCSWPAVPEAVRAA